MHPLGGLTCSSGQPRVKARSDWSFVDDLDLSIMYAVLLPTGYILGWCIQGHQGLCCLIAQRVHIGQVICVGARLIDEKTMSYRRKLLGIMSYI